MNVQAVPCLFLCHSLYFFFSLPLLFRLRQRQLFRFPHRKVCVNKLSSDGHSERKSKRQPVTRCSSLSHSLAPPPPVSYYICVQRSE